MSDIDNERLAKFEGKCWHEAIETTSVYSTCKSCGITLTRWYEIGWRTEREQENNPSYSTSPDDRERLWFFLVRDKKEMYYEFHEWAEFNYGQQMYRIDFDIWFSLPNDDGVPRWVSLLSEWLGMDSTVDRFGKEECPTCWKPGDYTGSLPMFCPKCNGSGKIRAEWAKEE